MHKDISAHRQYMQQQLAEPMSDTAYGKLYRYHVDRVRDFQHERLIHLLVTFFFGFLLLVAVTLLIIFAQITALQPLLIALCALLSILELAYIRHYYLLENGVQSLYKISEQFRRDP